MNISSIPHKEHKLKMLFKMALKMAQYNLKIIFAGRFIWFVLAALLFFILLSISLVLNEPGFDSSSVYSILFFPGILLAFYPTVFGIQNDADSRILEILFGIPNYRYKVWLVRLDLGNSVFVLLDWLFWINPVPRAGYVGTTDVPGCFSGYAGISDVDNGKKR
jgi:hypothetical protein